MSKEYKEYTKAKDTYETMELLKTMPKFCAEYYDGRQMRLTPKTQLNYLQKMKIFLQFLHDNNSYFGSKDISDYTLDDMALITPDDAREFVSWLLKQPADHSKAEKLRRQGKDTYVLKRNGKSTAENYIGCLSSYYSYFVKNNKLPSNPFLAIDREKRRDKDIIYMEKDQKEDFMAAVCYGDGLSPTGKKFHAKIAIRDICIMQLLLDTGIRVSELVGLNLEDVDLKNCKLYVQRKGDKPDVAYFSDDTRDIIYDYLDERKSYYPTDDETALFLVSQGKYKGRRIGVRSIEMMVKKYATAAKLPQKDLISPHKLRSTYAMEMLAITGNIALLREQLGHESIKTSSLYGRASTKLQEAHRNDLFK